MHDLIPTPTAEMSLDGEEAENELWRPKLATMSALESGVSHQARNNS